MEVNIDTEAVQQAIVTAVADSTIGAAIKEAAEKALKQPSGWNSKSILEQAASDEINRMIGDIVRKEIESRKEDIRKSVLPLITDKVILSMTSAAIEVMLGNLQTR